MIFIIMKIIITEKQLKGIKGEIDEGSSGELYRTAEKLYNMVKNRPFQSKTSMIEDIVRILSRLWYIFQTLFSVFPSPVKRGHLIWVILIISFVFVKVDPIHPNNVL